MRYLPHTEDEIRTMLGRIGVSSLDDLFAAIPASHRHEKPLSLEPMLAEPALMDHLAALADRNLGTRCVSFLGAGAYDHHIPPAVDQLLLRSEFYTAYTPYQAEVAQGTLQAVYEFQTIVCQLLGMEVANASMYDGASATAEAVLMARRITNRRQTVVSDGLHPHYLATIDTYLSGLEDGGANIVRAPLGFDGRTDAAALEQAITEEVAAVVVGYPSFMGSVEDLARIRELARQKGALMITATWEPYALSVLRPPGDFDADIAVGEGQALAVPPQFGGPGVGLFACRESFVRQMPGRLVGETVDSTGQKGYVLTLSTREQHIRRERATSNICTNHGLIALAMTIRTAMLGRRGFAEAGKLILSRTEYLKSKVRASRTLELPLSAPTFNEVVVRRKTGSAKAAVEALTRCGFLAGLPLLEFYPERPNDILVAVTERHDRETIDRFIDALDTV